MALLSEQKFKAPLGHRIALLFSWSFFAIMFFVILASDLSDGNSENYNLVKVSVGCISILAIMGIFLWNHISKTILIGNNKLTYSSLFKNVQIPLKEIKGYESTRHYFVIVPHKKEGYRKIRMTKSFPLNAWLSSNLSYLGIGWY